VAEVVLSTPWEAESMTISDLLTAQRRWGHTRCRRFLQAVPMSETKTVGSMTERQRNAIAGMLDRASEERRRTAAPTDGTARPLTAAVA
jgi:hypothetical protein